MRPERWRWWVAAALAYAAAFLAGHSQTFLFLSYAVAGWILFLLIAAGGNRARTLWRVAAFYGLFLALSAAQLLPSLEFAGLSVRANVDYAFVSGGFPLRDTWQMLLPGVVSTFSPLYVGLIPLGLALVGVVFGVRRTTDDDDGRRRRTTDDRRRDGNSCGQGPLGGFVFRRAGAAGAAGEFREPRLSLSRPLSVGAGLGVVPRPGARRVPGGVRLERVGGVWRRGPRRADRAAAAHGGCGLCGGGGGRADCRGAGSAALPRSGGGQCRVWPGWQPG